MTGLRIDGYQWTGAELGSNQLHSVIVLLGNYQTPIVFPQIWFWSRLASERSIPTMTDQQLRSFMSDEHSLDEQRIYNMACWFMGTGSEDGIKTAEMSGLSADRTQRCPGEYSRLDQGMKSQFKKYFKARPLRGTW